MVGKEENNLQFIDIDFEFLFFKCRLGGSMVEVVEREVLIKK